MHTGLQFWLLWSLVWYESLEFTTGLIPAYCSGGAWSVSGTCTNTDCTSLPVVRDADAGDCKIPTASGVTCTPTCKADFTGTLAAQCNQGAWLTSGSCTSTACANPPSLVNAAVGDCVIPSSSGTTCVPVCNSGFFGDLSASCSNTVWTVVGECKSTSCALVPFIQDAGNGDCVANAASGTTCTPVCNTGFAGTLSGMHHKLFPTKALSYMYFHHLDNHRKLQSSLSSCPYHYRRSCW